MKKTTNILLTLIISIPAIILQTLQPINSNVYVFANTTPNIIITEAMANPQDENKDEFIELYNASTTETVDLASWQFTDGDALDTIEDWDPEQHGTLTDLDVITGTTTLAPENFAIILDSNYPEGEEPYDFPNNTLILTVGNTTLGNGLSASSDPLTLYDNQGTARTNIISTYGTPNLTDEWEEQDDDGLDAIPFDPSNNYSTERIDFEVGDQEDNWQSSPLELGTPGDFPTIIPPNQPPVAEAGRDVTILTNQEIEFDGSSSYDPDGDDLIFSWDFGDGDTTEGKLVTHSFEQSGEYVVTLTVNDGGLEDSDTLIVTVNEPDYSDQIIINEILPNPAGSDNEDEFVELKNIGSEAIDLASWTISDNTDNDYTISSEDFISTEILPNDYFVIYRLVSGLSLNNSGDIVELIQPNNNVLQIVEYQDSAEDDFSYAYVQEEWQWTTTPTPGEGNILTLINQPPEAEAGEDKEVLVGEEVEFDASESFDPDNDELSFTWDFGDDEMGAGKITTHTYQEAGEFTITLTVYDGEESDTDTLKATVNESQNESPPQDYSDQIIINEIYPYPNSEEDEFIELKNNDTQEVDLDGWKLKDNSSRIFTITSDKITETKISANGFLVIYKDDSGISLNNTSEDSVTLFNPLEETVDTMEYTDKAYQGQSYILTTDGTWVWSSETTPGEKNVFLDSNNPPEIVLEADTSGKVGATLSFDASASSDPDGDDLIYAWDFGDGTTAEDNKTEHAYQEAGTFTLSLEIQDEKSASAEENLILEISDYDYSDQIVFNELMMNVAGDDSEGEWIELANLGGEDIDLEGWLITDDKTDYSIETGQIIPAGEFLTFYRTDTGITLNNDEDTLNLVDPRENIVSIVNYTESYEDLSFARLIDSDEWQWTQTPTPGEENEITESEIVKESPSASLETGKKASEEKSGDYVSITLKDIRNLAKGDKVITRGLVAVEPGLLGGQYFYIVEQDKGIKVYSSKKDFPELKLGDYIEVQGTLSESSSETKVNIKTADDIQVLENKIGELLPITLDFSAINEEYEGSLIQVEGEITDKKRSTIIIMDEAGQELTISIKSDTGIDLSEAEEGKTIKIVGLVSQDKDVYKILPRYQEDLIFPEVLGASTVWEEITLEEGSQNIKWWQYLLVGGLCLVVISVLVVKKRRNIMDILNKLKLKFKNQNAK